jgi:hypothetical protein
VAEAAGEHFRSSELRGCAVSDWFGDERCVSTAFGVISSTPKPVLPTRPVLSSVTRRERRSRWRRLSRLILGRGPRNASAGSLPPSHLRPAKLACGLHSAAISRSSTVGATGSADAVRRRVCTTRKMSLCDTVAIRTWCAMSGTSQSHAFRFIASTDVSFQPGGVVTPRKS